MAGRRPRRDRARGRRDLRARRRGARRELHRLPNRQRTRRHASPARHPPPTRCRASRPNGCASTSRPGHGSTSTGLSSRRSARRSAATASAPAPTAAGAPGRCRSPTSEAARAAPAPGRRCGNATPSAPNPGRPPSINDPADAIYTAARILREDMGAPPTGGSYERIPPGRVPATTARAPTRTVELRRRGDGPRRAIRVHRHRRPGREQPAARATRLHRRVRRERVRYPKRRGSSQIVQGRRKPDRPGRTPAGL